MTARDTVETQTESPAEPVGTDRFLDVVRAGRRVPAAALQAKHDLEGREDDPVNTDEKNDERRHEPTSMAKFPKKATRSCGRQDYLFLEAVPRAME